MIPPRLTLRVGRPDRPIADADDKNIETRFKEGEKRETFGRNVFGRGHVPTQHRPGEEDARPDDGELVRQSQPRWRERSHVNVLQRLVAVVLVVCR